MTGTVPEIRALVFDFDGLLVDTESIALRAWREVFAAHHAVLPLDDWHALIGTQDSRAMVLAALERQAGAVDRAAVVAAWRSRVDTLAAAEPLRDGVLSYLDDAADLGLTLAVASSATAGWVEGHLAARGIRDRFAAVRAGPPLPAKPDPAVYRAVLAALDLSPGQAVAFEDSPHGVTAARAAGLRCVAVPNPVTAALAFPHATVRIPAFHTQPLPALLAALPEQGA
ncbi:MAG: HAD family hydrolase [Mycobacteriales bacterium]